MDKVIMIKGTVVSVGMSNGSLKEIDIDAFNFTPTVGDAVKVFENEGKILVVKDEPVKEPIRETVKETVIVTQEPQSGTKVSKVTYVLLAIFLGGFGAHKFYAGKVFLGILYLIFFWTTIPAFIAFIEFIIALCKDADAQGNIYV